MKWAVVGGGVAGLAQGFALLARGHEVTVFEAAARAGGNIRTERDGGYAVEWGRRAARPDTFARERA